MRPGPRRPVLSKSNINLAYRSVDIAKGTEAEAALERISMAAKGLVECFGTNNRSKESKEEAYLEALEDFADVVIGQLQWHANFTNLFVEVEDTPALSKLDVLDQSIQNREIGKTPSAKEDEMDAKLEGTYAAYAQRLTPWYAGGMLT
ncbi:uncharacterized protein UDID_18417 [Ustilago sp. UG-2017a]|nr:uncharacterized protein UDID_18417 [Ustilago sp. UG-2017a]